MAKVVNRVDSRCDALEKTQLAIATQLDCVVRMLEGMKTNGSSGGSGLGDVPVVVNHPRRDTIMLRLDYLGPSQQTDKI